MLHDPKLNARKFCFLGFDTHISNSDTKSTIAVNTLCNEAKYSSIAGVSREAAGGLGWHARKDTLRL